MLIRVIFLQNNCVIDVLCKLFLCIGILQIFHHYDFREAPTYCIYKKGRASVACVSKGERHSVHLSVVRKHIN